MAVNTRSSGVPKDIHVLFQSDDYLVVSKPFDLVINDDPSPVTSSVSPPRPTLASLLALQFPQLVDASVPHHFRFVHRLDYSTSGVIGLALNASAAKRATQQFESRRVVKHYLALLRGHLLEPRDGHAILPVVVEASIGQDTRPGHEHKMTTPRMSLAMPSENLEVERACSDAEVKSMSVSSSHFRQAETHFHVLSRGYLKSPTADGETGLPVPATKVLIALKTGRRHQIRVHAQEIGHPIVGDFTYDDDRQSARMYLHACRLLIPWTEEKGKRKGLRTTDSCIGEKAKREPLIDVEDMASFEIQLSQIWTEHVGIQSAKELSDDILRREVLT